jgi:hypothetical protein
MNPSHALEAPPRGVWVEQRLCAAAALLLLVSPLTSFALSGFLLLNLSSRTSREMRWSLELCMAFALALIAGARPLDPNDLTNDIFVYYEVYRDIAAGDLERLTHFGAGLEVALPLLFGLWALVLPPLSVNGLMFCIALTASMLVVVWVESGFYGGTEKRRPAFAGICLVLMNIYFATQLSRQFLSLVVLLFAFTALTRPRRWLFVLLASSFHVSALVFYAIWLLARRGWPGWLAIVLLAFALRIGFSQVLAAFDVAPDLLADKLLFYVDNDDSVTDSDIGSLRMVGLLAALSILAFMAGGLRAGPLARPWLALPWLTGLVHAILLPIPLASLRATLIVHSVASGVIAWHLFAYRARALLPWVLNALLLYKVAAFAAGLGGANLRPTVTMLAEFLA